MVITAKKSHLKGVNNMKNIMKVVEFIYTRIAMILIGLTVIFVGIISPNLMVKILINTVHDMKME